MKLRELPVGAYGAVMGLAGLGLAARAAAPVLPGVIPAPAYFTELWVLLGVLALGILLPAYAVKLVRYPAAVREDFTNPALLGFTGALPVGMFLVAGGLAPYVPAVAGFLWGTGFALLFAFQIWALARWLSGAIELAQVNGGWMIVLVGGVVAPGPGLALGFEAASRFAFGVSAAAAPLLMALLFHRAVLGAPLSAALRPSWFILLVAPTLIYANGLALYPDTRILEMLFFAALVLAAALLVFARGFLRWPFALTWWAFTFPLDALAYAAARYALEHPTPLWRGVCAASLALATAAVLLVLMRTLVDLATRSASSRR